MNYTNIGLRIKKCRKIKGLTTLDVAKALNVHNTTISRYENGHIKSITLSTMKALSEVLGTSPEYLFGFDTNEQSQIQTYNSIELVSAKQVKDYLNADEINLNDIVLEMQDDSMVPTIMPKDKAVFRITNEFKNGDICIIKIGNNYTVKRVENSEAGLIIKPDNPKYSILAFTKNEIKIEAVSVYAKLKTIVRDF